MGVEQPGSKDACSHGSLQKLHGERCCDTSRSERLAPQTAQPALSWRLPNGGLVMAPPSSIDHLLERYPPDTTDPLDIPNDQMKLNEFIHWLFVREGLSREEYAERLGTTAGYFSGLFNNNIKKPPVALLRKLSQLHKV